MNRTWNAARGSPVDHDEADLFNYALMGQYAGFALRSLKRHPILAMTCVLLVSGLAIGAMSVLPKTYRVETVLQALRNPSLPTLANAGMYRPYESDQPTRAARETVLKRDNLIAIIEETNLLERSEGERARAEVFRDALARRLRGRNLALEERREALLARLEKALRVDITEGTVTLTLDWPGPQTAYDVVQLASRRFLETRHSTEIAMVKDALAILEAHAAIVKRQLDEGLEQRQAKERERAVVRRVTVPGAARAAPAVSPELPQPDFETARLENNLATRRKALADLEDVRRRRTAELQAQLIQYEAMYADKHPAIMSLKQSLEMLALPSPQLEALRDEVRDLERDLAGRAGARALPLAAAPPPAASPSVREEIAIRPADPRDEYEKSRLGMLFSNYASILDRIDAAKVEMDAAQAAFKYRYGVINPPQLPKRPIKPKSVAVIGGSVLASILLALFVTVLRDLRSGMLLERWQLEHTLGVQLLTEGDR